MNLFVVILKDSHKETFSSINEKCLKEQIHLILRYEALSFE